LREWTPGRWRTLPDLDLTRAGLERSFRPVFTRVHRNWLANLDLARAMQREDGRTTLILGADVSSPGIRVPVSRGHARAVRDRLFRGATGLRSR
jgi:DNA-binding LytR/AlgR family response regulator